MTRASSSPAAAADGRYSKFRITTTEAFLSQLKALPDRQLKDRVYDAIYELQRHPLPDGRRKIKLRGHAEPIYRMKVGDYRLWYRMLDGWVDVLRLEKRKDDYRGLEDLTVEPLNPPGALRDASTSGDLAPARDTSSDDMLPRPIDEELLRNLHVPHQYHKALVSCRTLTELCHVPVPEDILNWVFDCVTDQNIDRVMEERRLVIDDVAKLKHVANGEFVSFLLRLDEEQEQVIEAVAREGGPALVTGGPGSGKSIVALYAVRTMVRALQQAGVERPRVLFTTFTNALVHSSRQQLEAILGPDVRFVDVRTADSIARTIVESADGPLTIEGDRELHTVWLPRARARASAGTTDESRALWRSISHLSPDDILCEIGSVIHAAQLSSLADYLDLNLPARKASLNTVQRTAVWRIHEALAAALAEERRMTWSQMRRRALEIVDAGLWPRRYHSVFVDEAQDLEQTTRHFLAALCDSPKRLIISADINQSIYRAWNDLLSTSGMEFHTWTLKTSHRTTREIMLAARNYVGEAALQPVDATTTYAKTGPRPFLRIVSTGEVEAELLAAFFAWATAQNHVGYGGCAVLVPTNRAGRAVASRLQHLGLSVAFMTGDNLDLRKPVVKVLTMHTAKGLEFTAVAIAGFFDSRLGRTSSHSRTVSDETSMRDRRTMFVAMTRAMRTLMVISPANVSSPIFARMQDDLWEIRRW